MSDFFYLLVEAKYRYQINKENEKKHEIGELKEKMIPKISESDGFVPKSFPNHPVVHLEPNLSFAELEALLDSFPDKQNEVYSLVKKKK